MTLTPEQLEAAVQKTNALILAACPVYDPVTGVQFDETFRLAYVDVMVRSAILNYGATPEAIAQSVINTIKSVPPFADPKAPGYWSGWARINSEGYTDLASQFAPKGTKHTGPSPAEIKANAMATGNVQQARDGKPFLGLDGVAYDQYTAGHEDAAAALLAASPSQPAPVSGPPFGVGAYTGPERRVKQNRVKDRRVAVKTTGGGTISPGHGIA